jgi:hypothetical protein
MVSCLAAKQAMRLPGITRRVPHAIPDSPAGLPGGVAGQRARAQVRPSTFWPALVDVIQIRREESEH